MTMKRLLPLMLAAALLAPAALQAQDSARSAQVKRGEYLVTTGLCHDCHTPLVMGPDGPAPDMKRALSGHPQDIVVKAPAAVAPARGGGVLAALATRGGRSGGGVFVHPTPA